ncbi:MAG: cytochrome c peroxidase [Flavobacteriales bacterium]|jgi:cytochrome c peroxidase|nr:cytochrome c peroxidase [Flavobacteriales bacterium]
MNKLITIILIFLVLFSCRKKETINYYYNPTFVSIDLPSNFPPMEIPEDNPLTEEGILLGRHLFWEPRLSGDNTMTCASCHLPESAFSDPEALSTGINGSVGKRNSMVLQNLAWANNFFWDGRVLTLEQQVLLPVMDSTEMDENWTHFFNEIKNDNLYTTLFYNAFQTLNPDSTHAAKALAQFLRTMVSTNSKYDKVIRNETTFTPEESAGFDSFNSLSGGDCFHCHGGILGTDYSFKNNGLDQNPIDTGRGLVTNNPLDYYKFKVPSIRNIEFSGPYMHDGRFETIDEVVNFYSLEIHADSPNIDPLIEFAQQGGVQLNPQERIELKAFLLTLSDVEFINNPNFSDPH